MALILKLGEQGDDRSLHLTAGARAACVELGCNPEDVLARAKLAAPYTHARANRRHRDLCFYIEQGTVFGVWRVVEAAPAPQNDNMVNAICPVCEGDGCHHCRGSGRVRMHRPEYEALVRECRIA